MLVLDQKRSLYQGSVHSYPCVEGKRVPCFVTPHAEQNTGGGTVSMSSSLCMGSGDFSGGLQRGEDTHHTKSRITFSEVRKENC